MARWFSGCSFLGLGKPRKAITTPKATESGKISKRPPAVKYEALGAISDFRRTNGNQRNAVASNNLGGAMSRADQIRFELRIWREVQTAVASFVRGEVLYEEFSDPSKENRLATHIHDRIVTLSAQLRKFEQVRNLQAAE